MSAEVQRAGRAARRADDTEARRRAQREFERPLLLQAGAGTGKTSVLVARVVAWCLGPGWTRAEQRLSGRDEARDPDAVAGRVLERVVAITFTEAAAAEMEERIGRTLQQLAQEPPTPPGGLFLEADALPGDATLQRTRARALLAAFDRLRVSTIHAFCARLLREHPLEAGVHPRFEVDASGRVRGEAARETVEAWIGDPARADDEDFLELFEADVGPRAFEDMLDALLAAASDPAEFAEDPLSAPRIAALLARAREALESLLAAEAGCLTGMRRKGTGAEMTDAAATTLAAIASLGAAPPDADGLAPWLGELAERWEDKHRKRLAEFAAGRFPAKGERAAIEGREVEFVAAAAGLAPILRHLVELDPVRLRQVHRVLAPLYADAARRMHRSGAESFDGLLRKASRLLERHPEVTARVRARVDQLLVDEFQDTDAAQCALVARLALHPASVAAPGLFVVGDPKQSIYGWRNADLAAYEDFRAQLLAAGGAMHRLSVNYRSAPAVLDEVERVIAPVMREVPRAQPPFEPLEPGAKLAPDGPEPIAEYWIASDWAELTGDADGRSARTTKPDATAREARWLAADLLRLAREARQAGRAFAWTGIGILLRTTGDVDVYLEELRRAGIPYTVGRDPQYGRRREVVEARALVRTVLDASDQIALVATLRSAWVGVPDAAWRPLWQRGLPDVARRALDGIAGAREEMEALVVEAAAALRPLEESVPGLSGLSGWEVSLLHAVDVLTALRRSLRSESAEQFVERVRTLSLIEAGEASRFLGAWRLAHLERFFREFGRALEEQRGDLAAVARLLRRDEDAGAEDHEGRPAHPSEDAVQVMTIHGAKGLQFESVYLLQLHKGHNRRTGQEPFRAGDGDLSGEWSLGAARVATLGFDQVRAARERIEELERVRTLYVAMTRAKRRLVVSGHWSGAAHDGVHGPLLEASRGIARTEAVAEGVRRGDAWDGVIDAEGVRWVFLDRAPRSVESPAPRAAQGGLDVERLQREAELLRRARANAAAHARRPLTAAVTATSLAMWGDAHGEQIEGLAAPRRARPRIDPELASVVGSALHALLEQMDWESGTLAADWERERVGARQFLVRDVPAARRPAVVARFDTLVRTVRDGPFWDRLRELGSLIVARELPVLIGPVESGEGAVGAGIGAIDLVYRDPAGGFVIVDFKTDAVADPGALDAKRERYREQGRAYQRAVQQALGLRAPPRFEFWFLAAGEVRTIDA